MCVHMSVYTWISVCVHELCVHELCVHEHICTRICAHVCVHMSMYRYELVYVYIWVCVHKNVCMCTWVHVHTFAFKRKEWEQIHFHPLETAPPGGFICVFWTSGKDLTRAIFRFIVKITSDTARTWQTAHFLTHLLALSSSNVIQEYVLAWEPKNLQFHLRSASESMALKNPCIHIDCAWISTSVWSPCSTQPACPPNEVWMGAF